MLAETADLLLFDVGAEQFALPLASVSAVHDGASAQQQGAHHDRGVGLVRDGAEFIVVYEPLHALGVTRTAADPMLLMLGEDGTRVALLVDFAEAALSVSVGETRDLSGLGSLDGVVVGALRPAARWVTLLDAPALVEALAGSGGRAHVAVRHSYDS